MTDFCGFPVPAFLTPVDRPSPSWKRGYYAYHEGRTLGQSAGWASAEITNLFTLLLSGRPP